MHSRCIANAPRICRVPTRVPRELRRAVAFELRHFVKMHAEPQERGVAVLPYLIRNPTPLRLGYQVTVRRNLQIAERYETTSIVLSNLGYPFRKKYFNLTADVLVGDAVPNVGDHFDNKVLGILRFRGS
jgi:hypothetical protein